MLNIVSYYNKYNIFYYIIDYSNASRDPAFIVFLDVEKAFDGVEQPFLFAVLEKVELGSNFIVLVKLLYYEPMVLVNTNRVLSNRFSVSRGCHQGCPLSPLLFSLVIEPLAVAVRTNANIYSIKISLEEHRICHYVDSVLLYLKYPETSTDVILSVIEKYGNFSGYKINPD